MHRTTKIATKIGASAAIAAVALIASATAANAATVNPNGNGFVGKGEVQTAFGMNNGAIQKIIDSQNAFTFTRRAADHPVAHPGRHAGRHAGSAPRPARSPPPSPARRPAPWSSRRI